MIGKITTKMNLPSEFLPRQDNINSSNNNQPSTTTKQKQQQKQQQQR